MPSRMLRSFITPMVGPLRLLSSRPTWMRRIVPVVLLGTAGAGIGIAGCGLDLQGELVVLDDAGHLQGGPSSSGGTSSSGGGSGSIGSEHQRRQQW